MKNLHAYIQEAFRINQDNKPEQFNNIEDIFKNVDIMKWKWPEHGLGDSEYKKCQDTVEKFALDFYGNSNDAMEQLYLDTYPEYLKAEGYIKEINSALKRAKRNIDKLGWTKFAHDHVSMGWWHFMNWVLKQ